MRNRIVPLLLSMFALSAVPAHATPEKCAAAHLSATGKLMKCLAKIEAKSIKKGSTHM